MHLLSVWMAPVRSREVLPTMTRSFSLIGSLSCAVFEATTSNLASVTGPLETTLGIVAVGLRRTYAMTAFQPRGDCLQQESAENLSDLLRRLLRRKFQKESFCQLEFLFPVSWGSAVDMLPITSHTQTVAAAVFPTVYQSFSVSAQLLSRARRILHLPYPLNPASFNTYPLMRNEYPVSI
jgi:hypothetical protein